MAGGGVGEAMLIGAAVGAGTGGVMSAAQDKDVGQGMLMGALGGAATGGIGSGIGGAAGSAIEGAAANTATDVAASTATDTLANTAANTAAENSVNALAQQGSNQAANSMAAMPNLSSAPANINTGIAANTAAGSSQPAAGMGQGIFPGMSNANIAGAATTGGISGILAANNQPAPYQAPGTEPYNGPLSKFKMAGPSLSQYNYDPNSFRPSIAPGYAEGGIAGLAQGGVQQAGMFPQSQMDKTQFATPSQMPVSREVVGSDYDATIDPYTGDLPRFANGGGIDFVRNLQPGGAFGDLTADLYGAQVNALPFLKDVEPGGFLGATTPGRLDYEDRKRKEEEEKVAQDRAAKEAATAAMYNRMAGGSPQAGGGMAHGGIADLGSYSDGGRLLRGPGDGMSDNIPASIAGKQPARLADGEFVVPADVVSHLGNGSTDAGAKTLYSMMDKVRQARTGSKKQGREINANKFMPRMAQGGIASFDEGGSTDKPKEETAQTVEVPQTAYNPSVYNPSAYNYSSYTQEHRPSGNAPQYYGNIYRGESPDYSTPGYTLTGGNLGRWSNVAGEAQRAAQPASLNQQVTQSYLQELGRAPENQGFNNWMNSGLNAQQIRQGIHTSPESYQIGNINANDYLTGLYQSQLGRAPEQSGLDYWINRMKSGMTANQAMQEFQGTPEYKALHPQGAGQSDPYAVQQLQSNKPQTVRAKTVQDLIDESLAKYKADNPTYTAPTYSSNYWDSGGGSGGGEKKGGVIKSKRRGGIASLMRNA